MTTGRIILISTLTTIMVLLALGGAGVLTARAAIGGIGTQAGLAGALFHAHTTDATANTRWHTGSGKLCAHLDDVQIAEHTSRLGRWVQTELTLSPAQTDAFDRVTARIADRAQELRPLCDHEPADAAGHVAAVVQFTGTIHAAMQEVSIAFDEFYAALDPGQRSKLDSWFLHEHASRS